MQSQDLVSKSKYLSMFFGKSWNLFQNLIEHNIYKVFDYVWSYRVILSHTDSNKETHFVINSPI